MAQIRLKIKNLDKFRSRLKLFPKIQRKNLSKAINESILRIEAKAIPISPVKTGRLVGQYEFGRIKSTPNSLFGRVKPDVEYAAAVHDAPGGKKLSPGTPYANPSKNKRALAGFLKVAVDRTENKVNQVFERALVAVVKELAD